MPIVDRLISLREGAISFREFLRDTRNLWRYLAVKLLSAHNPGLGVGEDDVEQELLIGVWVFVGKWDPTRGVEIDRYVIFNASDKAKKWLDKQREAGGEGNRTRAPVLGQSDSIELEMATRKEGSLGATIQQRLALADVARYRIQPCSVELKRCLHNLKDAKRVVVDAMLETGNPYAAALYIYNHYPYRIRFELGSEQAAFRFVRRIVSRLCDDPALWVEED